MYYDIKIFLGEEAVEVWIILQCVRTWNSSGFVMNALNARNISKAHPGGREVSGIVLRLLACGNGWFRIPSVSCLFFFCECCVVSNSLWDGSITRSDESCRVWCVRVWTWNLDDEET